MRLAIMATGGIDSTTLLYKAVQLGHKPVPVYALYGQTVAEKEMVLSQFHCTNLGLDNLHIVKYKYRELITPLTDSTYKQSVVHDQEDEDYYTVESMLYHDTHIEGRNAIMLTNILAWCSLNKIDELWTGYKFTELDWNNRRSYKLATSDNGPDFVDAMNIVAKYGYSRAIRIRAPFMDQRMDKSSVVRLAHLLDVDLTRTHSCYFPDPCGKCDNCYLVKKVTKNEKK